MWPLLCCAVLFFVLTPGVLVTLPKGGSKMVVAATHALIFATVCYFSRRLVVERFQEEGDEEIEDEMEEGEMEEGFQGATANSATEEARKAAEDAKKAKKAANAAKLAAEKAALSAANAAKLASGSAKNPAKLATLPSFGIMYSDE